MTGNMVDSCHPNQLNEIGQWHKPWFFKHVEEKLHNGQDTEYIPIRDYYHRHSRYVCTSRKSMVRKHSASGGMLVSAREGKKTHICVFLPPPIQTPLFFLNLE